VKPGDWVEYGTSGPHGGDRLGEVVQLGRKNKQDCALIRPLSLMPGDGYLPDWYPLRMVRPRQPERWAYDARPNSWSRTYAEIRRTR